MAVGSKVQALIEQQGRHWERAVEAIQTDRGGSPFLLMGSGTSYYLAQVAAQVARRLGIQADAISTGDVVLEPEVWLPQTNCIVVITRSGETSEAIWALRLAKQYGKESMTVVCCPNTTATQVSEHHVCLTGADDDTVVMIRSFTSMLMALQSMWARQTGQKMLDNARIMASRLPSILHHSRALWEDLTRGARCVYILGSGIRYGIAAEGALKVQEMTGLPAFAYSPLEFRHGPRGAVTGDDLVLLLGQEAFAADEWMVLTDIHSQTSRLVAIAREPWFSQSVKTICSRIVLPIEVPDLWLGPLAVAPLQQLAWSLACANGRDPDHPNNLTKVVEIVRG